MAYKLITAPAAEPITLDEAKAHCKIEGADDDAVLAIIIAAARQAAESLTSRALINQTWELLLDAFPSAEIKIAKPPIASITSIKYIDSAGAEQTVADTQYTLDADTMPGWVLPAYGTSWPTPRDQANAVRIRFVTGYGASGANVPAPIRHWMLVFIATAYANREAIAPGNISEMPNAFVDGLLDPYRTYEGV